MMLKTNMQEVIRENKEWFIEVFQEVMEDYYLVTMFTNADIWVDDLKV
jgi:hypothetical protein